MANQRFKTSYGATEGVRSGQLRDVLYTHATERLHFFFWYAFSMKALIDRLNAEHGQSFTYFDGVDLNATDQYGDGDRSDKDDVYNHFKLKKKDVDILDCYATDFARIDAAHFNNLGISPKNREKFAELATEAKDPVAFSLYEQLKASCRGTRPLPASVNTGADKIVDNVHKRTIQKILNDSAPVTKGNVDTYVEDAKSSLNKSLAAKKAKGFNGVVAVRERYIAFYDNAADVNEAFRKAQDTVYNECHGLGLKVADYATSGSA
ncbi:MAG: hypothetical protein AAGD13_14320 [Pseudomonadota bacterium]